MTSPPPDRFIKDGQYWRNRAEEIQAQLFEEGSRQMMFGIAASYERLAERADRRAKEAK
jgi:hypothetical protein